MQKNCLIKWLSLLLCLLLIAATAITVTGCSDKQTDPDTPMPSKQGGKLGEGATRFYFSVVDAQGKTTEFEILTNQKTVGAALQELDLIRGEDSQYGLYVSTVNGITLDNKSSYWSFYVEDAYAMSGVDTTKITPNAHYALKVERL